MKIIEQKFISEMLFTQAAEKWEKLYPIYGHIFQKKRFNIVSILFILKIQVNLVVILSSTKDFMNHLDK